jgi:hypothetical protein
MFKVVLAGTDIVLAIAKLVPAKLAALFQTSVTETVLREVLATLTVLIFKHFPLLAALLNTEVAEVVVRLTAVVFP